MRVKIAELTIVYTIGAMGYCLIEIFWRGYSHWTMTVAGGICFLAVYFIERNMKNESLAKKCALSAGVITVIEFLVGCVVNIILGWRVWDYSELPFSIMGQVCLGFFLLWFFLSMPALFLSKMIGERLFG